LGCSVFFKKSSSGYWQTTVMLAASTVIFLYILLKEYLAYRKDIKYQTKLMGMAIVTSKSDSGTMIQTDSKQLKKLSIPLKSIFDQIEIGDTLTISIARHTKWLLQLEKDGSDLLSVKQ
jgi:hypothetical protein